MLSYTSIYANQTLKKFNVMNLQNGLSCLECLHNQTIHMPHYLIVPSSYIHQSYS